MQETELDFTPKTLTKKHIHSDATASEKEAFQKADFDAARLRDYVFQCVEEAMPDGTIAESICAHLYGDDQHNIMCIRRRCIDLRDLGKIRRHPERKTIVNARGNKCITWVVGLDPNAGRSKLREAIKRIAELEDEIRRLKS